MAWYAGAIVSSFLFAGVNCSKINGFGRILKMGLFIDITKNPNPTQAPKTIENMEN